jgi:hypothetical protein
MNLDECDPTFVQDLINSDKYVDMAIDWYLREDMGYQITKPITRIRKEAEQWRSFSDTGDFFIKGKGWVDAKHRLIDFPPYPFPTVFIVSKNEFDNNPCWQYFLINKKCTHALIINASTFENWITVTQWIEKRGRYRKLYVAPPKMFKLVEL